MMNIIVEDKTFIDVRNKYKKKIIKNIISKYNKKETKDEQRTNN